MTYDHLVLLRRNLDVLPRAKSYVRCVKAGFHAVFDGSLQYLAVLQYPWETIGKHSHKCVVSGSGGTDLPTPVEIQHLNWLVSFIYHKETVTNLKRTHSYTEQAKASPSNDNNLDIETVFSMTEDTLADLLILHESYKNQSIPSTCITDVKKRP